MSQIPLQDTNWKKNWAVGKIGFHLAQTNPSLARHAQLIQPGQKVLLPLCGKSLDLWYLQSLGWQCTGVELVEQAIIDFFTEADVVPQRSNAVFPRYTYHNIELIQRNIFATTVQEIGLQDAIYDRAALVALPVSIRAQYAEHVLSLLRPAGKILLITYDLPRPQTVGPPFAVRRDDVPQLYSAANQVTLIEEITHTPESQPFLKDRGLSWSKELIWLIEK